MVQTHIGIRPIRVWVAGCSTGQEAYSLAMLFHEAFDAAKAQCDVQIFASDADLAALADAREGVYLDTTGVSPARLSRYFTPEGAKFRVKSCLRETITFAQHDVLADPPFARLDMLSCRNLMIYLAPAAQDYLLELFHFALRPGGFLLLGKVETAADPDPRFQTVSDAARLYRNLPRAGLASNNSVCQPAAVAPTSLDVSKPGGLRTKQDADLPQPRVSPNDEVGDIGYELAQALQELERVQMAYADLREDSLSVSEEYQAANEELLASKEELQSLNEELTALNSQLQETIEKQRTTADDLQNVLYSTNVATLFLDTDLQIRFFTPATRSLFSLRPGDIGRPLADLSPLSSDRDLLEDARLVLQGTPFLEREIEARAGTWFTRRVLPYMTANERIAGVVITFSEITERHRAHEALENAERAAQHANDAKTRFLAAASHDLRQPLQTLVILEGLLINSVTEKRAAGLVGRLGETLNAMGRMLDVLLDINQIEAGAIRPEKTPFPIMEIFERLMTEFSYSARAKGLQLRMVPCSLIINSDTILLEQMLRNLVSNAIKYTHSGRVLIGCRRHGNSVLIEVWDTGIGIAESEIAAVFQEYHQVNNPARESKMGLGLGLSIVQRLGALLAHRVRAVSTLGRGSAFTVEIEDVTAGQSLPRAKRPQDEVKRAPASAVAPDRSRILIVEDDPEVRDLLDIVLRDQGHETLLAENGPSALALFEEGAAPPDLVLTDYNLPGGLSGLALAKELRDTVNRNIPAIVLTGDISTLAMRRISQQDVLHLAKPVSVKRLSRAVSEMLGSAAGSTIIPTERAVTEQILPSHGPVFLIDDDEALRASLVDLLHAAGHPVQDYPTAEAFLARYVAGTSGCLLIDAYLPGMSGIELLVELQARAEPLTPIMITGRSEIAIAVAAMRAGAVDFVEKPISGVDLLARIDAAMSRARSVDLTSGSQTASAALATLTPRQHEVLNLVLAGKASKVIAFELGISQRTIESHRAAIMEKLGAKSVPELVRLALGAP